MGIVRKNAVKLSVCGEKIVHGEEKSAVQEKERKKKGKRWF